MGSKGQKQTLRRARRGSTQKGEPSRLNMNLGRYPKNMGWDDEYCSKRVSILAGDVTTRQNLMGSQYSLVWRGMGKVG